MVSSRELDLLDFLSFISNALMFNSCIKQVLPNILVYGKGHYIELIVASTLRSISS